MDINEVYQKKILILLFLECIENSGDFVWRRDILCQVLLHRKLFLWANKTIFYLCSSQIEAAVMQVYDYIF